METPYSYLLITLGLIFGYVIGVLINKKKKAEAEKRVTELELNMLDDKLEISRLKTLIGKLLEMRTPQTSTVEKIWRKETI